MEKSKKDSLAWKTLSSEVIISRPPWLTLRQDRVQLPDGRVNPEFYVLEYPDWVNVIAITDVGRFGEDTGFVGGTWRKLMTISGNPSTTDNLTHCFVAEGVHDSGLRHLDSTEDIEVELMTEAELYDLLLRDRIRQSLMAAPLWRWFATRKD